MPMDIRQWQGKSTPWRTQHSSIHNMWGHYTIWMTPVQLDISPHVLSGSKTCGQNWCNDVPVATCALLDTQ